MSTITSEVKGHKDPPSKNHLKKLAKSIFGEQDGILWMYAKNPSLDDQRPTQLMDTEEGRLLVKGCLDGLVGKKYSVLVSVKETT